MPDPRIKNLERILAIRLDNIGDIVMTGPALRGLRRVYPRASITLMTSPAGSQVAPLLPWVDDVIVWRAIWQEIAKDVPARPEKENELVALLEQRRFDAAFIFTSFSQSPYPPAYACYLAGIPIRIGQSQEFGGALLSEWAKSLPDHVYQVERNLHLLKAAGVPAEAKDLELRVPEKDLEGARQILNENDIPAGQPYLVLAPGASAAARRYEETRFEQVARQVIDETGLPLLILGSQRETGKFPRLEALAMNHNRVVSLIGQTSVPEMAAVIQGSALLIGNNSGSMHMAAAFHRPMVILFSGTELFEQWAPRTHGARLLNRATPCTPCHGFQCPYQMECLDISPEEVAMHALDLLSKETPSVLQPLDRSCQEYLRR